MVLDYLLPLLPMGLHPGNTNDAVHEQPSRRFNKYERHSTASTVRNATPQASVSITTRTPQHHQLPSKQRHGRHSTTSTRQHHSTDATAAAAAPASSTARKAAAAVTLFVLAAQ